MHLAPSSTAKQSSTNVQEVGEQLNDVVTQLTSRDVRLDVPPLSNVSTEMHGLCEDGFMLSPDAEKCGKCV